MTGWTLKHEELGLALVPAQYRAKVKEEFALSDKKSSGFITVQISQPKKVGTDSQNRAFHALIGEYWLSGLSSYESYEDLKDSIKLKCAGPDEFIFIKDGKVKRSKTLEGVEGRYAEIPKSWTQFTLEERKMAIDMVIKEANLAGINSRKWDEIITGMMEDKIL